MALRPEPPRTAISLFSGGGGLDLGILQSVGGVRTVCYVEREAYAAAVLVARMEDASLDPAPVWDDVSTFQGAPWRGVVDLVHGGFPCQDISNAGKRAGIGGERSGLWREFARIVAEVQPRYVFIENVGALVARGLDVVLGDLAAMGFDAEWGCFRASDAGAPHRRERVFILAHAASEPEREPDDASPTEYRDGSRSNSGWRSDGAGMAYAVGDQLRDESGRVGGSDGTGKTEPRLAGPAMADGGGGGRESVGERRVLDGERAAFGNHVDRRCGSTVAYGGGGLEGEQQGRPATGSALGSNPPREWPPGPDDAEGWREVLDVRPDLEPAVCRMASGISSRVDRLRVLGNAVVPAQAALAWRFLWDRVNR